MSARPSLLANVVAAALSLAVAFSFGFSYGNVGNQATYVPPALHALNPDFLRSDWLIRETSPYHGSFEWIVRLADAVGAIPWVLAIANVLLTAVGLFLVFRLACTVSRRAAPAVFAIVLLLVLFEHTRSIGDSYVFGDGFQPSTLASVTWLYAMLQYLRNRLVASGIALALGGFFHANFLVLGIGVFALAHLASGTTGLARRLLQQLAPSVLVLAFFMPLLLGAGAGDGAEEARRIVQSVRSPHHYLPLEYLFHFWQWIGWTIAGLGAAWLVEIRRLRRALLNLLGSIAACVAGATLLTTVVFVPAVSQLFVWRLAPFGVLVGQVAIASVALRLARGELELGDRALRVPAAAIAVGALAVARWHAYNEALLDAPLVAVAAIAAICLALAAWSRWHASGVRAAAPLVGVAALVLAAPLWNSSAQDAYRRSTLLGSAPAPDERELYAWVRRSPPQSLFVIPPEMQLFRLFGERAVVVDWKSTPMLPAEVLQWYRRIGAVAGRPVSGVDDAVDGYRARSLAELRRTAESFGADFIVLDRSLHAGASCTTQSPLFEVGRYVVHAAREKTAPAPDPR